MLNGWSRAKSSSREGVSMGQVWALNHYNTHPNWLVWIMVRGSAIRLQNYVSREQKGILFGGDH